MMITKLFDLRVFPEIDDVIMTSSFSFTRLIQTIKRLLIMDSPRSEVAKNGIICQNWATQTLIMNHKISLIIITNTHISAKTADISRLILRV